MKRIYYAHSIALYASTQEEADVNLLRAMGFEVVNPNAPENDKAYRSEGMVHFEKMVLTCDALAFRANADGTINAGVAREIQVARDAMRPVVELVSELGIARRTLSVADTRQYLHEQGFR